jgi:Flp pilus assembly protein TadD
VRQLHDVVPAKSRRGSSAGRAAHAGLNVEIHPNESRAHSSLADAYLSSGDTARAIASFERALALNSQNAHAAQMLRRLKGS